MDEFARLAAEELVKSQVGRRASFRQINRDLRTPLNFFLDRAQQHVGAQFLVYWVKSGTPEMFSLRGAPKSIVIFSERYVELAAFVRQLLVDPRLAGIRIELAERAFLKLIGEFALRSEDPEFAVDCFLKSIVGKRHHLFDTETLMSLEVAPINEGYMSTWFYGLAHELGHLAAAQYDDSQSERLFPDETILLAIEAGLDASPHLKPLKAEILDSATTSRLSSVVGIDAVRSEGLADIFAASVLAPATHEIMQDGTAGPFRMEHFIAEMMISLNVVANIERCRRVARTASDSTDTSATLEIALHPIATRVRALMQREHLKQSGAYFASASDMPSEEDLSKMDKLIDHTVDQMRPKINDVDTGMGQAMRYALLPAERREPLLDTFAAELARFEGTLGGLEARHFCHLAEQLEARGTGLDALRAMIRRGPAT